MSLDFFNKTCTEPTLNFETFGICDDENGQKAYTDLTQNEKWIATVINKNTIPLVFTAIDKCVLNDHDYPQRGRCDGMLISAQHLYLIELKDQKANWKTGAIEQLESTINFLREFHENELLQFKHKKAFACNKKHGNFQEIDNEFQLQFFRKYKFRIDAHSQIIVI